MERILEQRFLVKTGEEVAQGLVGGTEGGGLCSCVDMI